MPEYLVSARKYRPMTFSTVVGQQALTTTLKNAISANKLAHAYLFCGPRGVGKTTCARIFAKTINCLSPDSNGESCGQCESCRSFDEGRSMNIHELDAASNNSVEDIRELIKQVQIPPQTGRYKVFIIDEVHMLSQQAFNAFLKTLEEPPSYVIFILATTEKHKILPTILSRCQVYDFARMTVANTVEHLKSLIQKEGYTSEDEALQLIAEKADGGMRDALSIFDQMVSFTQGNLTYQKVCESLNVLSTEYYFRLVDMFLENKVTDSMLLLNEILNKGFDAGNFINGLSGHMRQLLVARDASTLPLLECTEHTRQMYQQQAQKCPLPFIYKAIKLCNTCDQNYRQSRNKRLQVEICLIECSQITQEGDSVGSGLCPTKILKPIFKQQEQAQPAPAATTTAVITQPTTPKTATPAAPRLATVKLSNLGPSIHVHQEKPTEATVKTQEPKVNKPFTEADIILQWNRYIAKMPQERRAMAMRMQQMHPHLIDDHTFEIVAGNDQISQYMQNMKEHILHTMREAIQNSTLEMTIRAAEKQEISHILSKPALLDHIKKQNKSIDMLCRTFDLIID